MEACPVCLAHVQTGSNLTFPKLKKFVSHVRTKGLHPEHCDPSENSQVIPMFYKVFLHVV